MDKHIIKLKQINVLKTGFLLSLFCIILSVIFELISLCMILFKILFFNLSTISLLEEVSMVFLLPILYGIVGFFGGMLYAFLYNLISKWIGGLEFEVENIKKFSE